MIKKPTLIVLIVAVITGAVVYYFDWKRGQKENLPADTTKPAFSLQAEDITSLTLSRPAHAGEPAVHFQKQNGNWQIVQPLQTAADQSSVDGIVDAIAGARVSQTEPGTPDRLKAYGLESPALSLDFQTKNAAKHTLLLGDKDFTGSSVYAIADSAKSVILVPQSLFVSADKSLDDLRDRAVLHIESADVASFELKNASGEIAAGKNKDNWEFTKPSGKAADSTDVSALMAAVANAKFVSVASETPENLAKYGLASPAITFTADDGKGAKSTLLVGKKDGDDHFARDVSRPTVFRIDADLYKKLAEGFNDLRDKSLTHLQPEDVTRVEIHNEKGALTVNRKSQTEWTFEAPDAQKGKAAAEWKFLTPITDARADEVMDRASPDIASKLAKPAIEATLTTKDGKKLIVSVSNPVGDFVYARTSDGLEVYKMKKSFFDDLNFAPAVALY
ncbi:MAG: DUF4340 domain-containing protein [Candidatus Acidiferrales bacterium]